MCVCGSVGVFLVRICLDLWSMEIMANHAAHFDPLSQRP
jgi:hypothetical protein